MSNIDEVLSFPFFLSKKNNFYLFFEEGFIPSLYRESEVYKKSLTVKNFRKLILEIREAKKREEEGVYHTALYQAYLLMREYAPSDRDLFK